MTAEGARGALIRDTKIGAILFVGRVLDPTKES